MGKYTARQFRHVCVKHVVVSTPMLGLLTRTHRGAVVVLRLYQQVPDPVSNVERRLRLVAP